MSEPVATTTDYGALFRPRVKSSTETARQAELRRRRGGGSNTAQVNNAPSQGDQSERGANYGVDAPRQFKAREKNSDYKDHIDQIRQLRALATPSEDRGVLIFPTTELANKFKNFKALANEYEVNNQQCDAGNGQACTLAGRGERPTDYPSPFSDSAHYSANSYFGMGDGSAVDRQAVRAGDGTVQVAGSGDGSGGESSQARVERERNEKEDARIAKENAEGAPPRPDLPPDPAIEPDHIPETGSGSSVLKPKRKEAHDPYSGGGSHHGGDGGATHEPDQVHRFDTGGDGSGYVRQSNPVKDLLINLNSMRNPYGVTTVDDLGEICFGSLKEIAY